MNNILFPIPASQFQLDRYIRFMNFCRDANLDGKFEGHHFLPKSFGGSNDKTNIIRLTTRQHFIAHWMLWKAYMNQSMNYAFWMMTRPNKNHSERTSRMNSRTYATLRKQRADIQAERNRKNWADPVWAAKMRTVLQKAATSPEERARRSAQTTKQNSQNKGKRADDLRRKWLDPEWAAATSETLRRCNKKNRPVIIDGIDYFNMNEAARVLKITKGKVKSNVNSSKFPTWQNA